MIVGVVIDAQHDFIHPDGKLFVAGADAQVPRVAELINRTTHVVDDWNMTMDSHNKVDRSHAIYWTNKEGMQPDPFTIVTVDDITNRVWYPKHNALYKPTLEYIQALEARGNQPHVIWPEHCHIGRQGQNIAIPIMDALDNWCVNNFAVASWVHKGSNPDREHYGAVEAEVPDPNDPGTQVNTNFVQNVEVADEIWLMGWARSHCLGETGRQLDKYFSDPDTIKKVVLVSDGTCDVPGFEDYGEAFVRDMTSKGMQVRSIDDLLNQYGR